jgi:hypothetical protein
MLRWRSWRSPRARYVDFQKVQWDITDTNEGSTMIGKKTSLEEVAPKMSVAFSIIAKGFLMNGKFPSKHQFSIS